MAHQQRGHLCQCGTGCHGQGPCPATIAQTVYVPRHDPFTGERYPTVAAARLCGPCAERYLAESVEADP